MAVPTVTNRPGDTTKGRNHVCLVQEQGSEDEQEECKRQWTSNLVEWHLEAIFNVVCTSAILAVGQHNQAVDNQRNRRRG